MTDTPMKPNFLNRCLIVLAVFVFAAVVYQLMDLLLMIFAAVVVAVIIRAIARFFLRFPIGEGLAVTLAVIALIGIIVGTIYLFGDLVRTQFALLLERLPDAIAAIQSAFEGWGIDYDVEQASADIREQIGALTGRAGSFALSAGGAISNIFLVLAGAVFLAAQPKLYREGVLRLVSKEREDVVAKAYDDSGLALGLWLQAQLISSAVAFVMTYIALTIIGVPSAAALAIIAALLDFIPFIGPIIAAIPGVLVAFLVGPLTALWTVIAYLVVQQIQGNIIQPLVQKKTVDIAPAVLLFAVIAAGAIFGILGVLLSAPLTIVGFVLVQRLYIEDVLDKPAKKPGKEGLDKPAAETGAPPSE